MVTEAIRCENLSKHFGNVVALDDLNLAVEQGTAFGFLARTAPGRPRPCGC